MKTLLIIGGSGFLGTSFLDYANKNSFSKWKINKVICMSRKGKKIKNLNKKNISFSFIKKNILRLKKIPECHYVIYAANSKNNEENLKGLKNFRNLLDLKLKKIKILFTSSGAVYGQRNKFKKFKESDLINQKNINLFKGYKKEYAKTKIRMEVLIKKTAKKGFNVSIARLFSFFSQRILSNYNYAISDMVNSAKKFKYIKIKSNKEVYRSYMCSSDLVEWLMSLLLSSNKKCPIYNVGSDVPTSIKQLGFLLSKMLKVKLIDNPMEKKQLDFYVPSVKKIKKKFGLKLNQNFYIELKKSLR